MVSALNVNDIADKKRSLGYSENTDYLAYVQISKKMEYIIGTSISSLINKVYVISFEEDGLLFMGINLANKFTDNDKFVPLSQIGSISYKKSKLINGRLMFNGEKLIINSLDGKSTEHVLFTMLAIAKWVKADLPNVHKRIDEYPSLRESLNNKESTHANNEETKVPNNKFDGLRELKSLLDDGVINQEDFDTQKKLILNKN